MQKKTYLYSNKIFKNKLLKMVEPTSEVSNFLLFERLIDISRDLVSAEHGISA